VRHRQPQLGFEMPTPPPATNLVLRALLAAAAWLRARALRDHSSLYGGWYQQNIGGRHHFYFAVTCAPSRRIKPKRIEPAKALEFLERIDPGGFDYPPTQSLAEVVAFEVAAADSDNLMYEPERAARFWSNGRVELFYRAVVEFNDEAEATVDLAESVKPAWRLIEAVQAGHYRRLYGFRPWRRIDWLVQVSNTYHGSPRGSMEWSDLKFAGRKPGGRATTHHATAPHLGLGSQKLRSLPQGAELSRVLAPALTDLVHNSGWFDSPAGTVACAVEDTVAAVADGPGRV
jgi:hypothetical protein